MVTRPASTSSRRDEVLAVAAEQFARNGYRATTVRDIAEAAGVLSGSLYHHFESKEAMVDELLHRFLADLVVRCREIAASHDSPLRSFERLIEEAFDSLPRHRAAIMVYQQEGDQLARLPRFAYLRDMSDEMEAIWLAVIDRAVAAGELVTDNPKLAYQFIRDAVWISVRWYRLDGAWTTRDLARQFLQVVLEGLRQPG